MTKHGPGAHPQASIGSCSAELLQRRRHIGNDFPRRLRLQRAVARDLIRSEVHAAILQEPHSALRVPRRQPAAIVVAGGNRKLADALVAQAREAAVRVECAKVKGMHIQRDLHASSVESFRRGATIWP